ncbi:MAG TPA: beta-ketoacyl synthase N-terminal-like domain-containing protein, partial [Gaiellaceae bacterium]
MGRVAITGIGVVSPLGLDAASTWASAIEGRSGVDWIGAFDVEGLPVRIAGEVKGFDPLAVAPPKEARKLERNVLFALSASREALEDSGLTGFDPARVAVVFGSAVGGITGVAEQAAILRD